jgi:hypothetical protein
MAGIDQEISMRMNAANNNPQLLMQRYAQQGQNVLDLLAAQLLNNQNKAAENSVNAMFQDTPPVVAQLEQENAQSAQREVVNALRPGLEMQGQQMANQGIPTQPAPNMRMADGGIVGFKKGAPVLGDRPIPQGQPSAASQDAMSADVSNYIQQYNAYKASLANAPTPAEKQEVEARFRIAQQSFDPSVVTAAHQKMAAQSSMEGMEGFQGGGVVALKEGGILNRIMNYIRNIDFGGTSREADQFNREVMQALNERNMDDNTGIMTLRNMEPEETIETETMETMYVPSRAEQFSQMFPDVREAVNKSEGSEMGGIKYLKMIGEMQAKAKEDEARRALNYIKMMADNRGMIDAADPAANIPTFAGPEGSLVETDTDAAYRERTGRDRPKTRIIPEGVADFFNKLTNQEYIINEAGYRVPNPSIARSGEEIAETMREYEERMADIKEDIPGLSLSDRAVLAGQELTGQETDVVEGVALGNRVPSKNANLPDPFDVETIIEQVSEVQEESPEFRMKGVADAEKPDEKGFLDNLDIRRLQAFLAGGANQASAAGALGGGLRGLMAEDQRAEKMDLTERDIMGRIGASRYGSFLDYQAAMASLQQKDAEMIFDAEQQFAIEAFKGEQKAASDFLKELRNDDRYLQEVMRLGQEFEGPALAARVAAEQRKTLADYMDSRAAVLTDGSSANTFGYTAPSE